MHFATIIVLYLSVYVERVYARVSERQLSWDEVCELVSASRIDMLGRSVDMEEKYQIFRSTIASEWVSLADYVLVTKFYSESSMKNGKKYALPMTTKSSDLILAVNDYPYNLDSDIEHYILWKVIISFMQSVIYLLGGYFGTANFFRSVRIYESLSKEASLHRKLRQFHHSCTPYVHSRTATCPCAVTARVNM